MYTKWKPRPDTASQWPKAVGSRPAQPRSLMAVQSTEPLGAYTYYSQGNPGTQHHSQHRAMTGVAGTPRPVPQPQNRPTSPPMVSPPPTMYRPVTPPSSPPSSPPALMSMAVQPVPATLQLGTPREINPHTTGKSTRSRVSSSSSSRPTSPRCICHREHSKIMCYVCGKTRTGRVRLQCPEHPNTIHLMDFDRCPNCKAVNLTEIRSRPN